MGHCGINIRSASVLFTTLSTCNVFNLLHQFLLCFDWKIYLLQDIDVTLMLTKFSLLIVHFFFPDWLKADEVRDMILEGGADCVLLHKKGLYVAGQVSSTVNFILYASTKFCDFVNLYPIARIYCCKRWTFDVININTVHWCQKNKREIIKSVGVDCFSWL